MKLEHIDDILLKPNSASTEPSQLRKFASDVIATWKDGLSADANEILERTPEIGNHKSIVLDLAYEEYCQRMDRGEEIEAGEFCGRFPRFRSALRRLIELDQLIDQRPELLDGLLPQTWPREWDTYLGYDILDEIGRGAFARVYRAREHALGSRSVVLKIAPQGADEAKTLGRLNHPNIVPVYSVKQDDETGASIICMPYLGKATLFDALEVLDSTSPGGNWDSSAFLNAVFKLNEESKKPPKPLGSKNNSSHERFVIDLLLQLAAALSHAHERGVLHLDLKPSNILLTSDGTPMLLDFNLAFDDRQEFNRLGGTVPHMSPEQLRSMLSPGDGHGGISGKSDIYSLGVIGFQLLVGRLPFATAQSPTGLWSEDSIRELLQKQADGLLTLNCPSRRLVSPELMAIIVACLDLDPSRRPTGPELSQLLSKTVARRRQSLFLKRVGLASCVVLFLFMSSVVAVGSFDSRPSALRLPVRPQDPIAQAEQCAAEGDFPLAIVHLHGLVKATPTPKNTALLAYYCNLNGSHADAAFWYETSLALGNDRPELYNNLGFSYLQMKRFAKAEGCLTIATSLRPSYSKALHSLAITKFSQAKRDGGAPGSFTNELEQLLRSDNLDRRAFYDAAVFYAFAAETDKSYEEPAVETAREAIIRGVPREDVIKHPQLSAVLDGVALPVVQLSEAERLGAKLGGVCTFVDRIE